MTKENEYINEPVRNTNLPTLYTIAVFRTKTAKLFILLASDGNLTFLRTRVGKRRFVIVFTNYCIVARENNEHAT
jgi:hypothetical protein